MKAINVNGNIKIFSVLPKTWNNILNFIQASIELQQKVGFYDVVIPEFNSITHELGDIYFDEINQVFTYPVEERTDLPSIEEAKLQKTAELKNAVRDLYRTVQWYVEMKRMEGEPIPQIVIDKLRSIKTKYEQIKTQINSLTDVIDVLKFELPYSTIQQIKADLEQFE